MKMMDELIALNKRLAEIIEANSDTALISLMRASGTVIERPEGFTNPTATRDGGVFEFYELHTPVVVTHNWTLPVGTVLALDHKFCEIIENKVLAVPHEDLVFTVTDPADGIPELLDAKPNTRFVINDLDVMYTYSAKFNLDTDQCVPRHCYVLSGALGGPEEAGPLVNVTYGVDRVYDPSIPAGYLDKGFVEIMIHGQPDAKELPSKYQLVVDAIVVTESNRT